MGEQAGMALQFVVNRTFEAEVNGKVNRYLAGRSYTLREGSVYDDLRSKTAVWAAQGLIDWRAVVSDRPAGNVAAGE